jgi:hypothetical protein
MTPFDANTWKGGEPPRLGRGLLLRVRESRLTSMHIEEDVIRDVILLHQTRQADPRCFGSYQRSRSRVGEVAIRG